MDNVQAQALLLNQIIWNEQNAGNEDFENAMEQEEEDNGDGTLDGGVARAANEQGERKNSADCDLLFYLECEETLEFAPNHPILKPGVVVSIGLEKSTKLSAVFQRYVDFCNETTKAKNNKVAVTDLEFTHCQLLNGSDTAEANALMKNDRIKVRKVRTAEREAENERKRLQRDADKAFFQQLRHMMPDLGGSKTADLILDCQGKLADESGRNQQLLSRTVKAHSVILKKRCPWLGGMIRTAELSASREAEMEARCVDERNQQTAEERANIVRAVDSDVKSDDDDDENDDDSAVVSFAPKVKPALQQSGVVAEIEDEDASYDGRSALEVERSSSPVVVPSQSRSPRRKKSTAHRITINHSPEAVKLLLEYCYTNRVSCLGQEAFVQACKTRPMKHGGPIAPFPISASGSRRWPKNGHPTVTFNVAVAGIILADEAGLPRLSLMCEIAASQLVSASNVIEALSLCATQLATSGNDLPRLRKAAMDVVFKNGSRGVSELGRSESFKQGLASRRSVIVPTLLQGTLEAVSAEVKDESKLRDRFDLSQLSFEVLDSEDKYHRAKERKKRKLERIADDPDSSPHELVDFEMEDIYDEFRGWQHDVPRRSLKRMAKHLEAMTSRSMQAFQQRSSRYSFPTNPTDNSSGARRLSSRRRSGSSNQE
mmetsp:Transcript_90541/g.260974  ORF Transcript_90541/g.260974 Transcript_90541/m.260974 type:complete len:658 (-) Transcript_90541:8-1981(-)